MEKAGMQRSSAMNWSTFDRDGWFYCIHLWILFVLVVFVWSAMEIWPGVLAAMGILYFPTAHLDSFAILAAVDAARAGLDPHLPNPLDPLMRGHVYSDWWLGLKYLGLTRDHNFGVAITWIGAFGAVALSTTRPRGWGEVAWLAAILVSPPVLLAVNRANNDLVVFVLLAGCGLAATNVSWWRMAPAFGFLGLATGLKYFPAAGVLAFFWARPVRRMPGVLLMGLLVSALVINAVADQIDRGRFVVESGLYTMGAALWWRDFGWKDVALALPCAAAIGLTAVVLAITGVTTGLSSRGSAPDRFRAALGIAVLLACFVSGVSYAYRWIFVIWPAIWLWRQLNDVSARAGSRIVAAVACGLIFLCLWFDGSLCVVVNRFLPPLSQESMKHLLLVWRHWTQPFVWLLMILLAGWLIEAILATMREWWSLRHEP